MVSLSADGNDGVQRELPESLPPSKKFLKVEDVLEKLGGYSTFQLIATVTLVFLECPAGMIALAPVLTGSSNVRFVCKTNESIAAIEKIDLCSYNCSGTIMSEDGEPFHSVVQEWDLICEKAWITDTFTSVQMAGSMIGSLLVAQISDRYGRKNAFFGISTLMGISGLACAFSPNAYSYAIARFVAGFTVGGCFVSHFNYLMEFLTPSYRTICGCVSFWAIGEMILGPMGYFFSSWRTLSWMTSFPAFFVLASYWFLPESPRWLLCQNRTEEAAAVFEQIAKWNSKPRLESHEIKLLQESVLHENSKMPREGGSQSCLKTFKIFLKPKILKQLLIFMFAWLANAIIYFGISFNMKNLSGSPYLNVFYLGLVDFPAELSGMYFNNKYGRRKTFISYLIIASLFLIPLVFVEIYGDNNFPTLILVLCLCGRFCVEGSWAVMAGFTGESFPTVVRGMALGICAACSGVGGIIAPQLAYLGSVSTIAPYAVFCGLSLLSALTSPFLVEMKGKPLEDTVAMKKLEL